jgi:quercetin dioxygenase-like cupin family protein
MEYVGNFNFMQDEWLEEILSTEGQARPRDWSPSNAVESAEYAHYKNAGYSLEAVNWWVYEKQDVSFDIVPPWTTNNYHWWITKLYPGQYMPMHTDPHTHDSPCKRYWMPLQDHQPGHIFIYENNLVKDYKAGDLYSYIKSQDMHGAANIGHTPRVVLQVTEFI